MMPEVGNPDFLAHLDRLKELHVRKAADYGSGGDPLANLRRAADLGMSPVQGVLLRMGDKWGRICSWAQGHELVNDSVADDFDDLACYAMLARTLLDEVKAASRRRESL